MSWACFPLAISILQSQTPGWQMCPATTDPPRTAAHKAPELGGRKEPRYIKKKGRQGSGVITSFPKLPGISGPWDVWEPALEWWILVLSLSLFKQMQRLEKPSPVIKRFSQAHTWKFEGLSSGFLQRSDSGMVSWGGLWGNGGPSLLIDREVWTLVSKGYT